ncbi:MAG: insulinase family protein [Planctomycetota bacterium]|nr:MAG: insulinase family protein [Planctomycetota bacterium]
MSALVLSALLSLAAFPARQEPDGFAALAERVRERELANGLRVIVLPYGEAPVVSFHVRVAVGAIDEPVGRTGLAHFAEHMAFKGSPRIGSRDWPAERAALETCDRAWRALERAEAVGAPPERRAELEAAFEAARAAADRLTDTGAFDRVMETAGGRNSNASTGADATDYFVSLPAGRMETWFWLAREMFGAPVMREFYKERDVVIEERRMRTDGSPFGAALESLLQAAFVAHPYRDPTIGHLDDLRHLDRPEMIDFWRRHYTADRMILAVVGRVDPERVFALAETYLGDLPRGLEPRPRRTAEPPPRGPRSAEVVLQASPFALAAWPVPALTGRRHLLHLALADLLAGGPASRLHRALVQEAGLAVEVEAIAGFPGRLDPTLFALLLVPAPGVSPADCVERAQAEIDRLAAEGPSPEELEAVRRRTEIAFLEAAEDAAGLAAALAEAEDLDGGWRQLFRAPAILHRFGPEDFRRAAGRLKAAARTTVLLAPPAEEVQG